MKNAKQTINEKIMKEKENLKNFFTDERGDTNFISIAIILVVVIGLAVVFITFGNKITEALSNKWNDLSSALAGQSKFGSNIGFLLSSFLG